jgi:hypothetical protein
MTTIKEFTNEARTSCEQYKLQLETIIRAPGEITVVVRGDYSQFAIDTIHERLEGLVPVWISIRLVAIE